MSSMETRGVWFEMLLVMWGSDPQGIIEGTVEEISRLTKATPVELSRALPQIVRNNVADVYIDGEFIENGNREEACVTLLRLCDAMLRKSYTKDQPIVTLKNRRMYRAWKDKNASKLRMRKMRCSENVTPDVTDELHHENGGSSFSSSYSTNKHKGEENNTTPLSVDVTPDATPPPSPTNDFPEEKKRTDVKSAKVTRKEQKFEREGKRRCLRWVWLKEEEFRKLQKKYGDATTRAAIKFLDDWFQKYDIDVKWMKYKCHYTMLYSWVIDAVKKEKPGLIDEVKKAASKNAPKVKCSKCGRMFPSNEIEDGLCDECGAVRPDKETIQKLSDLAGKIGQVPAFKEKEKKAEVKKGETYIEPTEEEKARQKEKLRKQMEEMKGGE